MLSRFLGVLIFESTYPLLLVEYEIADFKYQTNLVVEIVAITGTFLILNSP